MKTEKCCKKVMELKAVTSRISEYDLFFQCTRCGKTLMIVVPEFTRAGELNENLLEEIN